MSAFSCQTRVPGRRQRHQKIQVINLDDEALTTTAPPDPSAMTTQLTCVQEMLQCVFPIPREGAPRDFESLVKPRSQPFDGYSPEQVLRSVRMLVICYGPAADLPAESSGKRVLSELLKRHLETYATRVTAALDDELRATAPPPAIDEEAQQESEDAPHANTDSAHTSVNEDAFHKLVLLWKHYRSGAGEVASVWMYLGSQSHVSCSVRYLEAALDLHPCLLDQALAGFATVLSRVLRSEGQPGNANGSADCAAWKAALHDFSELFLAVNQYVTRVQPAAVATVRSFYEAEAKRRWADEVSAVDYFRWIEASWSAERERCHVYLHHDTTPLLEAVVDDCVLNTDIAKEIVDRDFGDLVEHQAYESLQLLLRVASRSSTVSVASVATLTQTFRAYIENTGKGYMRYLAHDAVAFAEAAAAKTSTTAAEKEDIAALMAPFGVVCAMMALMRRCEDAVQWGLNKCAKEFATPLHEGLQTVLAAHAQPFSDQLAQYLDFVMKEIEDGVYPLTTMKSAGGPYAKPHSSGGVDGTQPAVSSSSSPTDASGTASRRSPPPPRRSRSPQASSGHAHDDTHGQEWKRAAPEVGARPSMSMHKPRDGETVLGTISRLFSYHPTKDLFEAFYWRGLCCRLLHPFRVPNLNAEEHFIKLLKVICGGSVTSKFEGMLMDVSAGQNTDSVYAEWIMSGGTSITKPKLMNKTVVRDEEGEAGTASAPQLTGPLVPPPPSLQLHCRFFTSGYWPVSPFTIKLPPVLARQAAQLEGFYQASHNNRRLQWRHGMATAELRARYDAHSADPAATVRTYQLLGTFAQSLILMYLDSQQPRRRPGEDSSAVKPAGITVKDLCEALGMERTHFETRDALHGLCHARCPLLLRAPGSNNETTPGAAAISTTIIAPTDLLMVNDEFTSPTIKVRIPCFARPRAGQRRAAVGAADHADEEAAKVAEKVLGNRDMMIEVAISRYMKSHKTCSHAELVEEAPKMLRFSVTSANMKRCIEKLLARNFLSRSDDGGYSFVA